MIRYKIFLVIFIFAVTVISGCDNKERSLLGEIREKEVSPGGLVTALVTYSSSGGATVPFVYRVYLQQSDVDRASEVLRADKLDAIHVVWNDKNTVTIKMVCGQVFNFRNSFSVLSAKGKLIDTITIKLETNGLCN